MAQIKPPQRPRVPMPYLIRKEIDVSAKLNPFPVAVGGINCTDAQATEIANPTQDTWVQVKTQHAFPDAYAFQSTSDGPNCEVSINYRTNPGAAVLLQLSASAVLDLTAGGEHTMQLCFGLNGVAAPETAIAFQQSNTTGRVPVSIQKSLVLPLTDITTISLWTRTMGVAGNIALYTLQMSVTSFDITGI